MSPSTFIRTQITLMGQNQKIENRRTEWIKDLHRTIDNRFDLRMKVEPKNLIAFYEYTVTSQIKETPLLVVIGQTYLLICVFCSCFNV